MTSKRLSRKSLEEFQKSKTPELESDKENTAGDPTIWWDHFERSRLQFLNHKATIHVLFYNKARPIKSLNSIKHFLSLEQIPENVIISDEIQKSDLDSISSAMWHLQQACLKYLLRNPGAKLPSYWRISTDPIHRRIIHHLSKHHRIPCTEYFNLKHSGPDTKIKTRFEFKWDLRCEIFGHIPLGKGNSAFRMFTIMTINIGKLKKTLHQLIFKQLNIAFLIINHNENLRVQIDEFIYAVKHEPNYVLRTNPDDILDEIPSKKQKAVSRFLDEFYDMTRKNRVAFTRLIQFESAHKKSIAEDIQIECVDSDDEKFRKSRKLSKSSRHIETDFQREPGDEGIAISEDFFDELTSSDHIGYLRN